MNSELLQSLLTVAGIGIGVGGPVLGLQRFMQPFHNRAFICWLAAHRRLGRLRRVARYARGEGGFKLGVDLVGGTILVYEVDVEKLKETSGEKAVAKLDPAKMVEFLKTRIDPNDLYNVTIRPVGGNTRYEIILPTGGSHQANIKQEGLGQAARNRLKDNPTWKELLRR